MLIGVDEPLGRGRGWPAASLHLQVFGRPGHTPPGHTPPGRDWFLLGWHEKNQFLDRTTVLLSST